MNNEIVAIAKRGRGGGGGDALLELWSQRKDDFSGVNCATIASKLGQLVPRGATGRGHRGRMLAQLHQDDRFRDLVSTLARRITMEAEAEDALRRETRLSRVVREQRIDDESALEFNSRILANITHAVAKLRCPEPEKTEIFDAVTRRHRLVARRGTSQAMVNTVWAFATMNVSAPALFDAVAENAGRLAAEGNAQNLSNAAWAYATMVGRGGAEGVSGAAPSPSTKKLFGAVSKQSARLAAEGDTQHLANTVWAFATAGVASPELFEAVARQSRRLAEDGNAQDLAITAWAFATAGVDAPELFAAFASQGERLARGGTTQALSMTVWAYATLGLSAPHLFDAVERQSERLASEGTPQELANTVWAFATVGVDAPRLFDAVSGQVDRLVAGGTTQHLANIAWSFAVQDARRHALFIHDLWSPLCENIDRLEAVRVARAGRGGAVGPTGSVGGEGGGGGGSGHEGDGKQQLTDRRGRGGNDDEQDVDRRTLGRQRLTLDKNLTQMMLARLAVEVEAPGVGFVDKTSNRVAQLSAAAVARLEPSVPSYTHMEVSRELGRLGWRHENEVDVLSGFTDRSALKSNFATIADDTGVGGVGGAGGAGSAGAKVGGGGTGGVIRSGAGGRAGARVGQLLSLDMADSKSMVAVEFNGPSHFTTNMEDMEDGENDEDDGEYGDEDDDDETEEDRRPGSRRRRGGRAAATRLVAPEPSVDVYDGVGMNGSTHFKIRLLRAMGWRVVSIDYRDWERARAVFDSVDTGAESARHAFLREAMAGVGVTTRRA